MAKDISVNGCSSVAMYILYRSSIAGKVIWPNPGFMQVNGKFLLI